MTSDTDTPVDGAAADETTSRTALPAAVAEELRRRALSEADCVKFTMIRHQGLGPARESLKPISLRGETAWQHERFDGRQIFVRNHSAGEDAKGVLESLLAATGAREYHLTSPSGDLHVRVTRKGHALVSRGKPQETQRPAAAGHDHAKDLPLARFDSSALLRTIGIADSNGSVRASMRGKYDQINAFLRELDALLDDAKTDAGRKINIVDCGCGRAYLTLGAYCYLTAFRGMDVAVRGIDRNATLVDEASEMAQRLDVADRARFICADIKSAELDVKPDLLLSLHACDLAPDLAIARGIWWRTRHMLVAPCCQHDLQKQITTSGPMKALLRHGILRERLCDILTDAFRAQLLRIHGYRVRVSEFVSQEATSRNIMLRASIGAKPRQPDVIAEYTAMRDEWGVVPALERILAASGKDGGDDWLN